jgi:hypothetical protein
MERCLSGSDLYRSIPTSQMHDVGRHWKGFVTDWHTLAHIRVRLQRLGPASKSIGSILTIIVVCMTLSRFVALRPIGRSGHFNLLASTPRI